MNTQSTVVKRIVGWPKRLAESHPYLWKAAWEAIHHLPFLLPHDKSYFALRHFIVASPGGLFVDIGANDGISVLSFRKFDKAYRILSFEPNVLLRPNLEELRSRDPNFEYRMVGVGYQPSKATFFVPVFNGIVLHTFCSLRGDLVLAGVEQAFGRSVASRTTVQKVESDIVRLDDLNLDPTIIKIDAEGSDLDALLGAQGTIERKRPFVMVECWPALRVGIKQFFDEQRYVMLDYNRAKDCFCPCQESALEDGRNIFGIPEEKLSRFVSR